MKHVSVLLNESIVGLSIRESGIYVDATLGYAGHSKEILKRLCTGVLALATVVTALPSTPVHASETLKTACCLAEIKCSSRLAM